MREKAQAIGKMALNVLKCWRFIKCAKKSKKEHKNDKE